MTMNVGKYFHLEERKPSNKKDVKFLYTEDLQSSYTGAFARLHEKWTEYYPRWYHEKPMVITGERQKELRELHRVLYKCIEFMALNYKEFVDRYMPLSKKEMELLEEQSKYPFRAGTYRPDYLISNQGELVLCEITSRFFAHGIFISYFSEYVADRFMQRFPGKKRLSYFEQMMEYMIQLPGEKRKIAVLKSADKTSEIRLYEPYYQKYGYEVRVFEADEVEANIDYWKDAFVISALNQKDIMSFSRETCTAMMAAGMYNDFRTVFLIHDKRFMHLWFVDEFTDRCLTREETAFLRSHAIPTYLYENDFAKIWNDAYENKEGYILKHHRLGKSEKVYAGALTDEATWKAQWETNAVRDMILQPFVQQRTFQTIWEGTAYDDFLCGMMLCVDDRYFDSGLFRASSLPVTNVGDDRKISPLLTDDPEIIAQADVL